MLHKVTEKNIVWLSPIVHRIHDYCYHSPCIWLLL